MVTAPEKAPVVKLPVEGVVAPMGPGVAGKKLVAEIQDRTPAVVLLRTYPLVPGLPKEGSREVSVGWIWFP
jgi:hypothetical protein